jgi:hypothetical protein
MPIKKLRGAGWVARCAIVAAIGLAALPGIASAATCPDENVSQPFAALGDSNSYFIVPGGDFEGQQTWTTTGWAGLQDNERNGQFGGGTTLGMASGATATSPAFCLDAARPHMRFALKRYGYVGAVKVEVLQDSGDPIALGVVDAGRTWDYSPSLLFAPGLNLGADTVVQVRLRMTAIGPVQIDAVAVDPWRQ